MEVEGFNVENNISGPSMQRRIKNTKVHPILHFIKGLTLTPILFSRKDFA